MPKMQRNIVALRHNTCGCLAEDDSFAVMCSRVQHRGPAGCQHESGRYEQAKSYRAGRSDPLALDWDYGVLGGVAASALEIDGSPHFSTASLSKSANASLIQLVSSGDLFFSLSVMMPK